MVNNSVTQILDFEEIQTTSAHPGEKEYKKLVFSTQPFPNNSPKKAMYKYPSRTMHSKINKTFYSQSKNFVLFSLSS